MEKGIFFGASVTAQSKGAGYCDFLKKSLSGECEVTQRGFGACHFDDAGFFYISEVLNEQPDFLVFEWNTTGLNKFDQRKFSYVINEIGCRKIPCGFLILPRKDKNISGDRDCEKQVRELCALHKVPLLDLRGKVNVDECLRDVVHTNPYGAEKYGEIISEWVKNNFLNKSSRLLSVEDGFERNRVRHDAITPIRQAAFANKRVSEIITIIGEIRSSIIVDIAASVTVGPQSPSLRFDINGASHSQSEITLFDAWCDYERVMTVSLWPKGLVPPLGGKFALDIEVLSERPDYSICRKKDFKYDGPMFVDVHSLHTSGIGVDFIGCK